MWITLYILSMIMKKAVKISLLSLKIFFFICDKFDTFCERIWDRIWDRIFSIPLEIYPKHGFSRTSTGSCAIKTGVHIVYPWHSITKRSPQLIIRHGPGWSLPYVYYSLYVTTENPGQERCPQCPVLWPNSLDFNTNFRAGTYNVFAKFEGDGSIFAIIILNCVPQTLQGHCSSA